MAPVISPKLSSDFPAPPPPELFNPPPKKTPNIIDRPSVLGRVWKISIFSKNLKKFWKISIFSKNLKNFWKISIFSKNLKKFWKISIFSKNLKKIWKNFEKSQFFLKIWKNFEKSQFFLKIWKKFENLNFSEISPKIGVFCTFFELSFSHQNNKLLKAPRTFQILHQSFRLIAPRLIAPKRYRQKHQKPLLIN